MEILITLGYLALIVLSGVLYRLGGAGDLQDGYDFLRKRNMRLVGVSLVTTVLLLPSMTISLASFIGLFLTIGFSVGALSLGYGGKGELTHEQSFLYRIFGERVFFAVGFLFGIAIFPLVIAEALTGNKAIILPYVYRVGILTLLIPAIHHFRRPVKIYKWEFDSAQVEEFGRGVAIASTLLIV